MLHIEASHQGVLLTRVTLSRSGCTQEWHLTICQLHLAGAELGRVLMRWPCVDYKTCGSLIANVYKPTQFVRRGETLVLTLKNEICHKEWQNYSIVHIYFWQLSKQITVDFNQVFKVECIEFPTEHENFSHFATLGMHTTIPERSQVGFALFAHVTCGLTYLICRYSQCLDYFLEFVHTSKY